MNPEKTNDRNPDRNRDRNPVQNPYRNSDQNGHSNLGKRGPGRFFLIFIILLIAVVSFIAGRYTTPKPYINQMGTDNGLSDPTNHRQGIPPDSLPH